VSARAVVAGVIFRAPTIKISKNGNRYALATIRSGSGDAARWWKVFAFSESVIEEITTLADGEPVAVAGEFDCEQYSPPGGEPRLSWKVVADAVLSARRRKSKPRQTKAPEPRPPAVAPSLFAEGRPLNDEIPF
jgi:hypothetical protein